MRPLVTALALGAALAAHLGAAQAADPPQSPTAQQSKMATCNQQAAGKTGDDRKAFMKECLSSKPESAPATSQRDKMKTCNADAAGKTGDERKAFMKACLSKKA